MSKKKKASAGKAGKKSPVKKTAKSAVKPATKQKATKKAAAKPEKAKKSAKKSPAKSSSAKKKVTFKSLIKKISKAAKSKINSLTSKKSDKKVNKKVSKPVNKATPLSTKKNGASNNKPQPSKAQSINSGSKSASTLSTKSNLPKSSNSSTSKAYSAPEHKQNGSSKELPKNIKTEKTPVQAPVKAFAGADKNKKTAEAPLRKQQAEKKSGEVLAISNTIPVKQKNEISPSKIASISYAITNPVKRTDSYAVKPEKEPNGKFELEFVVHASAEMLYEFLSSPSGLSEWFCDDLNIRNGIYTFIWDDQLQQARLLKTVDLHLVRFQWVDKTDGSYFEFKIQRDDLTNDISLIITDFADTASERESSKLLWHSQVEKLMHVLGSIF